MSTKKTPDSEYGIKSTDEKRTASQFMIQYHNCLYIKKCHPTIGELEELSGLSIKEIEAVTGRLVEKGRAFFNNAGGLVLKGYENFGIYSAEEKPHKPRKTKHKTAKGDVPSFEPAKGGDGNSGDILGNPLIEYYLSGITRNNSVDVTGLLKKLRDNPYVTDEKLLELVKAADVAEVRQHLTPLSDLGIVSFKRKKHDGWVTYYWELNPERLKSSYISNANKNVEDLESRIKEEGAKARYFCMGSGDSHPVLDFDSVPFIDEDLSKLFKCQKCGGPLVLKTGEDLIKPLEEEISILKKNIEEVKKIKLNGSA